MTTIPTVAQANKILTLGKFILGGLGFLIAGVFTITVYGTTFMRDTANSFDRLSTGLKDVKEDVSGIKYKQESYHIDDVQFQQHTDDRLKALEENRIQHYPRSQNYSTQNYNQMTGVRTMVP